MFGNCCGAQCLLQGLGPNFQTPVQQMVILGSGVKMFKHRLEYLKYLTGDSYRLYYITIDSHWLY